jgi:hypothetical protein
MLNWITGHLSGEGAFVLASFAICLTILFVTGATATVSQDNARSNARFAIIRQENDHELAKQRESNRHEESKARIAVEMAMATRNDPVTVEGSKPRIMLGEDDDRA